MPLISLVLKRQIMQDQDKTCPSSKFTKGSLLIGIKNEEEEMELLADPIKITEEVYLEIKSLGVKPEKAVRVANKCIKSGCRQWTGEKCGVIDDALDKVENQFLKNHVPECAIRTTCRWYSQQGEIACKVCPLVSTYTEYPTENKFFRDLAS